MSPEESNIFLPEFRRKLYRYGLILSPIFGIFSIIPLLIFVYHFGVNEKFNFEVVPSVFLTGIFIITSTVLFTWFINVWLLRISVKFNRPYTKYLISYVLVLGIVFVASQFIEGPPIKSNGIRIYPLVGAFMNNTILWLILHNLYSREYMFHMEQERSRLELSSIHAKHESIKRQIQPHFLFNSLANLKNLIESQKNDQASEYTSSLSVFLRKSLELGQSDLVTLKNDWEFAKLYMEIQQLRFGDAIQLKSNLEEAPMDRLQIPVFALQLVLENVYKHNAVSESNPMPLEIQFDATKSSIRIKNPKRSKQQADANGVGLKNLQERSLHLIGRQPEVVNESSHFEITLFCKSL